MKTFAFAELALLMLATGCAVAAEAAQRKPGRPEARPIKIVHSWSGKLADAALRKHLHDLPANGFVLDQEGWKGLWKAWRGRENVPAVDFEQQMVIVFTAVGPNSVGCDKLTLDRRGNVRANVMTTLIGGPGFGYLMLCIPREGVKSVNGTPLPGVKLPPKKPWPQRPFEEPDGTPGSSGASDPGEPGVVESSEALPPEPGPVVVESPTPPITELDRVRPKGSVREGSTWKKPLVLTSERETAEHFDDDELARLTKQVDFDKQFVLLFVWRGSGQDRLEYAVAESYPAQIFFTYKPGRTRDLIEHVRAYALQSNVKWSIRQDLPRRSGGTSPDTPVQSPGEASGAAELGAPEEEADGRLKKVAKALAVSQGEGLFLLATERFDAALPLSFAYRRDFATRYLTVLESIGLIGKAADPGGASTPSKGGL